MNDLRCVVIAGGGTGGHLFSGLGLYDELKRRHPSAEFVFVGTERGIEARVIPELGLRLELIASKQLKGKSVAARVAAMLSLPASLWNCRALLKRLKPDVVIGVGGYASGPLVLAAAWLGVPTAVIEQNIVMGFTNRMLVPWINRAYLSYDETKLPFRHSIARVFGNPVRTAFLKAGEQALAAPEQIENAADSLLILGGSQGAHFINQAMPSVVESLAVQLRGVRIVHQAGSHDVDEVKRAYQTRGIDAQVHAFIDDTASEYLRAKVVVSRAGATSLAELSVIGRSAVLIPFPQAADDHQRLNAQRMQTQDAALVVEQNDQAQHQLVDALRLLLSSFERRLSVAEHSRRLGRPGAAQAIADDLATLCV